MQDEYATLCRIIRVGMRGERERERKIGRPRESRCQTVFLERISETVSEMSCGEETERRVEGERRGLW